MKKSIHAGALLAAALLLLAALATPGQAQEEGRKGKSGFKGDESGFGGPASVGEQLREDDELKEPAFRFPGFDRFFSPWFNWKRGISEKYGLEIGLDYSALYQGASDVLPDAEDQAASGALRSCCALPVPNDSNEVDRSGLQFRWDTSPNGVP